uniref:Alkaline phosphatase family protein n=1 Tax=Vischeria sp. CAUP Q 202 TaxID=1805947 RepID=A0A1D8RDT9_9STRA|nr:hypothetical protein NUH79_pgp086 [Vischeria punctata]AOW70877.1 hypothetical protein [Vischeria sp. CAUP Q 202]UTV00877.1 hypothetical protein [Vischeria punctata]
MKKTIVLNIVGLTSKLIGPYTPFLKKWIDRGKISKIKPLLPAVTSSVQSTYLTGKWPDTHGIVGNGWYFRDLCEIKFWHQSNTLVTAPKIWDIAKNIDPSFTCANMFWWYNMYSTVDYSVTPRPIYTSYGTKIPDCYTFPTNLRDELQTMLGRFPLFNFWGPKTSIESSKWIADASKIVEKKFNPTLTLIYLPHLDYCLQRSGPQSIDTKKSLLEIDLICKDLIRFYESRGANLIILSEYGIEPVNNVVHINRILRKHNYLKIREENGRELLDPGASDAFAVCDHQIAHIYINNKKIIYKVFTILKQLPGIAYVLDDMTKQKHHLNHSRAGDLIAVASEGYWFSYYYWIDDQKAPDFARTVEIHKKPGYDPAELFIDPNLKWANLKILITLLKKIIGFRYLMNLIPIDASLVKGSHGRITNDTMNYPIIVSQKTNLISDEFINAIDVFKIIMQHLKD